MIDAAHRSKEPVRFYTCNELGTWKPASGQQVLTIGKLLTEGWEIAEYISVADNRSRDLFKYANVKALGGMLRYERRHTQSTSCHVRL